jgi:hypothetical protein
MVPTTDEGVAPATPAGFTAMSTLMAPSYGLRVLFMWNPTPGAACVVVQYRRPPSEDWLLSNATVAMRLEFVAENIPLKVGTWCFSAFAMNRSGRSDYTDETCIDVPDSPAPVPPTIAVSIPATREITPRGTVWFQQPATPPPAGSVILAVVNQSDQAAIVSYDGLLLTVTATGDSIPMLVTEPDGIECVSIPDRSGEMSCEISTRPQLDEIRQLIFAIAPPPRICK